MLKNTLQYKLHSVNICSQLNNFLLKKGKQWKRVGRGFGPANSIRQFIYQSQQKTQFCNNICIDKHMQRVLWVPQDHKTIITQPWLLCVEITNWIDPTLTILLVDFSRLWLSCPSLVLLWSLKLEFYKDLCLVLSTFEVHYVALGWHIPPKLFCSMNYKGHLHQSASINLYRPQLLSSFYLQGLK